MKLLSKVVGLAAAICLLSVGGAFAALPDAGVTVAPAPIVADCPTDAAPAQMFVEVTSIADCDATLLAEAGLCAAPTTRDRMILLITSPAVAAEPCAPQSNGRAPPG